MFYWSFKTTIFKNQKGASITELMVALLVAALVVYLASAPMLQMNKLENQVDFQGQLEMAQQIALLKARNGKYIKEKLNLTPGSAIDKCFGGRGTGCTAFSLNNVEWDKVQFKKLPYQATSVILVSLTCTNTSCGQLNFTVNTTQDNAGAGAGTWRARDLKAGFNLPAAALGSRQEIDYSNCIGMQITGIDYVNLKAECKKFTGNNTCKDIDSAGPLATFGQSANGDATNCQAPVKASCPNGMKNIGLADGQAVCVDEMVCTDTLSSNCSHPIIPPACVPVWEPAENTVCDGQSYTQINKNCDSSTRTWTGKNAALCPVNPCTYTGAIKWPDASAGACGNSAVNISTAPKNDGVVANTVLGFIGTYTAKCLDKSPLPSSYDIANAVKTCSPIVCPSVPTNLEWSSKGVKSAVAGPGLDPVGPWPCQGPVNFTNNPAQAAGVLLSTQADGNAQALATHNASILTATSGSVKITCDDPGPVSSARNGNVNFSNISCASSACPAPQEMVKEIDCTNQFAADTVTWEIQNQQSYQCKEADCASMADAAKTSFCDGVVESTKRKCACAILPDPPVCGIPSVIKPKTKVSGDCVISTACGNDTPAEEALSAGGSMNTVYTCKTSNNKDMFYLINGTQSEFLKKVSDTTRLRVTNKTNTQPQTKTVSCEAIPTPTKAACPLGVYSSEVIKSGSCAAPPTATTPTLPNGVKVDVSITNGTTKSCPSILNPGEGCADGILEEPNYCGTGNGSDYLVQYCAPNSKPLRCNWSNTGNSTTTSTGVFNDPYWNNFKTPYLDSNQEILGYKTTGPGANPVTVAWADFSNLVLSGKHSNFSCNPSIQPCCPDSALVGVDGKYTCTLDFDGTIWNLKMTVKYDSEMKQRTVRYVGSISGDLKGHTCDGAVVGAVTCPAMPAVSCTANVAIGEGETSFGALPQGNEFDIAYRQDLWFSNTSCVKAISSPKRKCTCGIDGTWACDPPPPICPSCASFGSQMGRNYPGECVQGLACFVAGTLVTMADGSKKKIEEVQVGDMMQTFDEKLQRIEVSPVEEVQHHDEKMSTLYHFTFSDGAEVTSNDIHRYYLPEYNNYFTAAEVEQIWRGHSNLKLLNEKNKYISIKDVQIRNEVVRLFNLHVTSPYDKIGKASSIGHNYFANGVLVHNYKVQADLCDIVGSTTEGKSSCAPPFASLKAVCAIANGVTIDIDPAHSNQYMVYFHGSPANMRAWQDCYAPNGDCRAGEGAPTKTVLREITTFGTTPTNGGQCYVEKVGSKCIIHTVQEGPCKDAPNLTITYDEKTKSETTDKIGDGRCKNKIEVPWENLGITIYTDGTCDIQGNN